MPIQSMDLQRHTAGRKVQEYDIERFGILEAFGSLRQYDLRDRAGDCHKEDGT